MFKRSFLFRTFLFFSLFFLTYVSAEEEWTIKKYEQGNYRSIHSEEYKSKTEKKYEYY